MLSDKNALSLHTNCLSGSRIVDTLLQVHNEGVRAHPWLDVASELCPTKRGNRTNST